MNDTEEYELRFIPGARVFIETRKRKLGPYRVVWTEGEDVCIAPESDPSDQTILNGSFVWPWDGEEE